jgi:transcriptional regulator with XRE-family HTH domain
MKVFELANKVGVNAVYITQIEKNNKSPSPSVMRKIDEALKAETKLSLTYIQEKRLRNIKELSPMIKELFLNVANDAVRSWDKIHKEDLKLLEDMFEELEKKFSKAK